MADQPGTIEVIARELAVALQPLEQRLSGDGQVEFLGELGLRLPGGFAQAATAIGNVAVKAGALAPLVVDLVDAIDDEDGAAIVAASFPLVTAIGDVIDAIASLEPAISAAVAAAGGLTPAQVTYLQAQASELPGRMLEWTLLEYIQGRSEALYSVLTMLRIVDDDIDPGDPADAVKPPHRRRALHLDRVVTMLTAPDDYLTAAFAFGDPGFDGMALFTPLYEYLQDLDLAVDLLTPPGLPPVLEAYVVRLTTIPGSPPSLSATVRIPATRDVILTFPLGGLWVLTIRVAARFDAGMGVEVRYPLELKLIPPTGSISAEANLDLVAHKATGPMILLGEAGGSRLELDTFSFGLGVAGSAGVGAPLSIEPRARLELEDGRLVIDFSNADGFIGAVAGGFGIDANIDLAALWSPSTGLQIEGSGGIEIAIPTHISLGPIEITALYLRVLARPGRRRSRSSCPAASRPNLGPLQAVVDRIGVIADLTFPPDGGNLGPARPRLRVQAAERRRARRRRRRRQGRRLPLHRRRPRRVRRRARARHRRHRLASRRSG